MWIWKAKHAVEAADNYFDVEVKTVCDLRRVSHYLHSGDLWTHIW